MVEGQLDAIRCWDMGFRTAVAPQGTAFKDSQALLLYRSRPKGVVCLLDGDAAGKKDCTLHVSIFLKAGLDARFAELPKGSDPDQILMGKGINEMHKIIKDAQPMVEYVIKQKIPVLKEASPKQKESAYAIGCFLLWLKLIPGLPRRLPRTTYSIAQYSHRCLKS